MDLHRRHQRAGVLDAGCLDRLTSLDRVSLNGSYLRKRYVGALISGIPFKLIQASHTAFF